MKRLDVLAAVLLVVGGLNWGLVGLANVDLVALASGAGAFGAKNALGMIVYLLVGLAAAYQLLGWKAIQRRWATVSSPSGRMTTAVIAAAVLSAGIAQADSCGSGSKDVKTAQSSVQEGSMSSNTSVQSSTIVDVAISAGSFKTLVAAVQAAGLVDVLKGEGPFTVFAPTDEAFAKLPAGTVEALLKDKAKLTQILTYHVVPGKVMAADVVKLSSAKTVQGGNLTIRSGKGVMVDNANVIQTDIAASNGVIHVIDSVILPKTGM